MAYFEFIYLIPALSTLISYFMTKKLATAEGFFWLAWVFVLLSVEISHSGAFYLYPYYHTSLGKKLIFYTFFSSSLGFISASLLTAIGKNKTDSVKIQANINFEEYYFLRNIKFYGKLFLVAGSISFIYSFIKYGGSIHSIRIETLENSDAIYMVFNYFMYLSYPALMILGARDGAGGKVDFTNFFLIWGGLVLHGLAVGGRINIVVGACAFILSFAINANKDISKRDLFRPFLYVLGVALLLFSLIGLVRSQVSLYERVQDRDVLYQRGILSIFSYVSDSAVATGPHAEMAIRDTPLGGKFLFDGVYRLLRKADLVSPIPVGIFGHEYYRAVDIRGPIGWCQTNAIPRMVADFGLVFFPLGFFFVSFISQFLSLRLRSSSLFSGLVATWFVLCSIYSIQSSMWFSAQTFVVVIFSFFMTRKGNFNRLATRL